MHSSTSSFERRTPDVPWPRLMLAATVMTFLAFGWWEYHARSEGYVPGLDDTTDIWAERRMAVKPDSLVIIGDSRPHFDMDLDVLEAGLGKRPVQLAIDGSSCYPIFMDLANDESFKGDLIISMVPMMYFSPGSPLVATSEDALRRRRSISPSQRFSNQVYMFLDEHLASFNLEDLKLSILLLDIPIADRPGALVGPRFPPCFQVMDRERRDRMLPECAIEGSPMQMAVKASWQRLFSAPPPPPTWIPPEVFGKMMDEAVADMFAKTAEAVKKIRSRGGRVVFVRFPHSGWVKELEDQITPRAQTWDKVLAATRAPGIYYSDHPELASFTCPEWSHLSAPDSVEFSKRIAPLLKKALEEQQPDF